MTDKPLTDAERELELLRHQRDVLLESLKEMVGWFADPGRRLFDQHPEVYLGGALPIVSKARGVIAEVAPTTERFLPKEVP